MSVYESTTLTAIRQEVLRRLDAGIIIPNAKVDSFAAGSITSADLLRNSNWGGAHFQNLETVIYRPGSATAADNIRYAGALTNSTGLLAHTGANYSDTTVGSEGVELWYYGVRPDLEFLDALNRRLRKVYISSFAAISHLGDLDGDMAKSTDSDWTNVGSPGTSEKATTAIRTPFGLRSYHVINASSNEGTSSARLSITQGMQVRLMAISSCNVGTASLQPYDITNSASFGTAVTHSEEEPQLMMGNWETSPSTCKEFRARMLGTAGSTDDIFWNSLWAYKQGVLNIPLPTYVSEGFKAPTVSRCIPTLSNPNSPNCYVAASLDFDELRENRDFRFLFHQGDANPYAIQLASASYLDYPLAIEVRRPLADLGTFTSESSTTVGQLNQLIPEMMLEAIDTIYGPRFGGDPRWTQLRNQAAEEVARASLARPIKKMATPERWSFNLSGARV